MDLESYDKISHVKITKEKLDLQKIVDMARTPITGAISTFSGTTRNFHDGKKVLTLEYEAYIPMAEKKMQEICDRIREKWDVVNIIMYHRIGEVPISETSVIVVVSSVHRKDAIEACQYGIDEIKATVPIWKKEYYEDGSVWKENQEFRERRHRCCK